MTTHKLVLAGAVVLGVAAAGMGALIYNGAPLGDPFVQGRTMCELDDPNDVVLVAARLRERLELTKQQLPAWLAARDSVRVAMDQRRLDCAAIAAEDLPANALDSMARREQRLQASLDQIRNMHTAVLDLRNVLDDQQKIVLDDFLEKLPRSRG